MSDDIIINGLNGNQPAAANTTGAGTGGGNTSTGSGTSTSAQAPLSPKNKTEQNPVIDLRQLEPQKGSATGNNTTGGSAGTTGAAAATTPTQPAVGPALPNLSLEEAAMMETSAVMTPADRYSVPPLVREKFPDLVDLIKQTESMNNEERDYWFQILPIMTEEQIGKFRDILLNEKQQLAQLDKEYEHELNKLNEKHIVEWEEFKSKEKRAALTAKESKAEAQEKAEEEELLQRLSQI